MKKIVIVSSTAGSVFLNVLSRHSYFLPLIDCVVSDRYCLAIEGANKLGIKTLVMKSPSGADFSEKLVEHFIDLDISYFISFYTKIFRGRFLELYEKKILNFHPSILPAFPGGDGFGDSVNAGARFIGSTVHFVDQGVDTGRQIIQAARPFNPKVDISENRHLVFLQQCKMLTQVLRWIANDTLEDDSSKFFEFSEFSPNLDLDIIESDF